MDSEPFSPEQHADFEALSAEFVRHIARVGVDMEEASPQLRDVVRADARAVERGLGTESMMDVPRIVEALRGLPANAGTAAFVQAYRNRDASPERPNPTS